MQLQKDPLSQTKPANLPNMEIIKDKMNDRAKFGMTTGKVDFLPGFVRPTMSRGRGNADPTKRGSANGGRNANKIDPPRRIEIPIQKVTLHQAEHAWKPGKILQENGESAAAAAAEQAQDPYEDLVRKARAILNKLTPQKFDTLVQQFDALEILDRTALAKCMELVFEKAVDEPSFSVAYAKMCCVLAKKEIKSDGDKKNVNFRNLLLTRVQTEFLKDYVPKEEVEAYEKELEEAPTEEKRKELRLNFEEKERIARRRSLGNIRFIGELYKEQMLTAKIMHECVINLIHSNDEESLECLCKLMSTVGRILEIETEKLVAAGKVSIDSHS